MFYVLLIILIAVGLVVVSSLVVASFVTFYMLGGRFSSLSWWDQQSKRPSYDPTASALAAQPGMSLEANLVTRLLLYIFGVRFFRWLGADGKAVPLRYNFRNLQVRWKTTLVTALAFPLVTALLTVMLAFVRGMDSITQSSAVPGNVIVLADGALDEVFSDVGDPSITQFEESIQKMIKRDGKGGKPLMSKRSTSSSHAIEPAGPQAPLHPAPRRADRNLRQGPRADAGKGAVVLQRRPRSDGQSPQPTARTRARATSRSASWKSSSATARRPSAPTSANPPWPAISCRSAQTSAT